MTLQGLAVNVEGSAETPLEGLASMLSQLPSLHTLNISYSRLGNTLPASLSKLKGLRVLDISNSFAMNPGPDPGPARPLPAAWCNMTLLKVLKAEQAGLGGNLDSLPLLAGCLPSLEALHLGGNRDISGTLPAGEHSHVKKLPAASLLVHTAGSTMGLPSDQAMSAQAWMSQTVCEVRTVPFPAVQAGQPCS